MYFISYSLLVADTTLALDNPLRFRCNILEKISKLIMTIDVEIRDKNLQCNINIEAAKMSALLSGKFNKYEYLASEEILPSSRSQITGQTKFTYSPLGKALKKQTKMFENYWRKQIEVLVV